MSTTEQDILLMSYALRNLRPEAEWGLDHTIEPLYDGLDWWDQTQTKPTEAEVAAEMARLRTSAEMKALMPTEAKMRKASQ